MPSSPAGYPSPSWSSCCSSYARRQPAVGALVHAELAAHGVEVLTSTTDRPERHCRLRERLAEPADTARPCGGRELGARTGGHPTGGGISSGVARGGAR